MISFRDLASGFRKLNIPTHQPVLAHVSLSAFDEIKGGVDTLLAALLATVDDLMMPTFTYQTMVIPHSGPTNNALDYAMENDQNSSAEIFSPSLPCYFEMGEIAEKLRNHPQARRSRHPILSFSGIGVDVALEYQTLLEPLAPIQILSQLQGWVLLAGCDQTVNSTIHLAEAIAGRKQFIRWALTEEKVVECPHFPGCSQGFNAIDRQLQDKTREVSIGHTLVRAYAMQELLRIAVDVIQQDPLALLCSRPECEYCSEIRRWVGSRSHWIPLH